jgi:predicted amidohydrolase YtcJ
MKGCVRAAFPWLAMAMALGAGAAAAQPADIVYRNGHVYTADPADSVQQAVAIRAGRLLAVGSNAQVAARVGPKTQIIDLQGRTLMP